jgi:hypothetical protein
MKGGSADDVSDHPPMRTEGIAVAPSVDGRRVRWLKLHRIRGSLQLSVLPELSTDSYEVRLTSAKQRPVWSFFPPVPEPPIPLACPAVGPESRSVPTQSGCAHPSCGTNGTGKSSRFLR